MNKKLILVLSLFLLAGCSSNVKTETTKKENETKKEETTTIANPFKDCDSLEDAAKIAGFELSCPDTVMESDSILIQAVENDMIQVIYYQGEDEVLRIRKSNSNEDITGDYNEYSEEVDQDIDGISVHLKGEDGEYSTISWTSDDYQYCILSSTALSVEDVSNLISSIK